MPPNVDQNPLSPLPLMQLSTSFWAFKTLAAAQELKLFDRLAEEGGVTADELAESLGIHLRPAEMLLTGCAALGLLEKRDERYHNSPLADEYLVRGKPYYFGGFVEMMDKRSYDGWRGLTDAIRTNRPTTWDPAKQSSPFEGLSPQMMQTFWGAMHSLSTFTARALGEAVDFTVFTRLLDIGGGSAAYPIELCRRYPHLQATVYELPFVTEIAAQNIASAGLSDRIGVHGGDFFADAAFPDGYDVMVLSMILHDWDEEKNRGILRKAHAALPSGGTIIISELIVNDEKTGPVPAALMSLNMLIETEEGRNYTADEYGRWLSDAGFVEVRTTWFEGLASNGAVLATKP